MESQKQAFHPFHNSLGNSHKTRVSHISTAPATGTNMAERETNAKNVGGGKVEIQNQDSHFSTAPRDSGAGENISVIPLEPATTHTKQRGGLISGIIPSATIRKAAMLRGGFMLSGYSHALLGGTSSLVGNEHVLQSVDSGIDSLFYGSLNDARKCGERFGAAFVLGAM